MAEWRNWAGNVTAAPSRVLRPRTTQDVVTAVLAARERGERVRPVGSGHSFTAIAAPEGAQMSFEEMRGVISVDDAHRVRVRAGTPLHVLVAELAQHGLALANMGDIDRQSIAGAVSTSTHGTGLAWTGMGANVVGGEMVTGTGEVLRWSEGGENSDLVPALGVTLGALGVLTELEVQCVPAFRLGAVEAPSTLTAELACVEETLAASDHYEMFWFPHTDKVMTKRNRRLTGDEQRSPLPAWKYRLDDEFLSNTVFEWVNRLCARWPALTRHVNRVSSSALSAREYTDDSHVVYASPRTVRFRESEMSVPLPAAEPMLRELQRWVAATNEPVAFPVEVRWSAGDDRWMSTAYGRESCYIAVHHYHRMDHTAYFERFWSLAREYGARPHWGKMHDFDAADLREAYPRFGEFVELRDRMDPQRVFTNAYLDRVLGA